MHGEESDNTNNSNIVIILTTSYAGKNVFLHFPTCLVIYSPGFPISVMGVCYSLIFYQVIASIWKLREAVGGGWGSNNKLQLKPRSAYLFCDRLSMQCNSFWKMLYKHRPDLQAGICFGQESIGGVGNLGDSCVYRCTVHWTVQLSREQPG